MCSTYFLVLTSNSFSTYVNSNRDSYRNVLVFLLLAKFLIVTTTVQYLIDRAIMEDEYAQRMNTLAKKYSNTEESIPSISKAQSRAKGKKSESVAVNTNNESHMFDLPIEEEKHMLNSTTSPFGTNNNSQSGPDSSSILFETLSGINKKASEKLSEFSMILSGPLVDEVDQLLSEVLNTLKESRAVFRKNR